MNEVIASALRDFSIEAFKPIFPRDLDLGEPLPPRAGNLVKVVIGMRRSGKSYRLFQEMDRLLASGVPENRICYFDFDDDRLKPITPATGTRCSRRSMPATPPHYRRAHTSSLTSCSE